MATLIPNEEGSVDAFEDSRFELDSDDEEFQYDDDPMVDVSWDTSYLSPPWSRNATTAADVVGTENATQETIGSYYNSTASSSHPAHFIPPEDSDSGAGMLIVHPSRVVAHAQIGSNRVTRGPFLISPDSHDDSIRSASERRNTGGLELPSHRLLPSPSRELVSSASAGTTAVSAGEIVVEVIGGVHKGKSAIFVKRTEKRVGVRLLSDASQKVLYLGPHNVRFPNEAGTTDGTLQPEPANSVAPRPATRSVLALQHSAPDESQSAFRSSLPPPHMFLDLPIQHIHLLAPGEKRSLDGTFAGHVFGNRLIEFKVKAIASVGDLPRRFVDGSGHTYELLLTKIQKRSVVVGGASSRKLDVTAHYVSVNGPGLALIDLKTELNLIAAFGALTPKKAASRLELLCSSARRATQKNRDFLLFTDLTSRDFEFVPEIAHEGCGFVPPHYVAQWLGTHAVGKRTFALQVRVFGPRVGVAKGMLVVKPGIDRIQLPPSMMKVGPSREAGIDRAAVVITKNGIYPFPAHCYTARNLSGGKEPPKSFRPTMLSSMLLSLLKSLGVPSELLEQYIAEYQADRGKKMKHANLVGLTDPTNSLPSGHVFLTGVQGLTEFGEELFVTRYPCTEAADGTVWPVVREKPSSMSQVDWTWLQSLHFGGIIFANPMAGQPPLPSMIAAGDLDGDLYFVCWHAGILGHLRTVRTLLQYTATSLAHPIEVNDVDLWNANWLEDAQDLMRSIGSLVDRQRLIGVLFKTMKQALDPAVATAFSRAYKDAIDTGKHGGSVRLPRRHWDAIEEHFHRYFSDEC